MGRLERILSTAVEHAIGDGLQPDPGRGPLAYHFRVRTEDITAACNEVRADGQVAQGEHDLMEYFATNNARRLILAPEASAALQAVLRSPISAPRASAARENRAVTVNVPADPRALDGEVVSAQESGEPTPESATLRSQANAAPPNISGDTIRLAYRDSSFTEEHFREHPQDDSRLRTEVPAEFGDLVAAGLNPNSRTELARLLREMAQNMMRDPGSNLTDEQYEDKMSRDQELMYQVTENLFAQRPAFQQRMARLSSAQQSGVLMALSGLVSVGFVAQRDAAVVGQE